MAKKSVNEKRNRFEKFSDRELKIIKDGFYVLFVEHLYTKDNIEFTQFEAEVLAEINRRSKKNG